MLCLMWLDPQIWTNNKKQHKMGKSNSKLTAEAMDKLKQDTYCEYTSSFYATK